MKKVLILLCVIITVMLASCGYSKSALIEAKNEAYQAGFEEGYDLAKYEDKGEIEIIKSQYEWEMKGMKEEYSYYIDSAYDAGYEAGYDDCLEEHGLVEESTFDPNDPPRIKKDK